MAEIERRSDVGGHFLDRRAQHVFRLPVLFICSQGKRQVHLGIDARAGIDRQFELARRRAGLAAREVDEAEQMTRDRIARPRLQMSLQSALGRTMPAGP